MNDDCQATLPLCIIKTGDTLPALAREFGDFEDWISSGLRGQGLPLRVIDARSEASLPAVGDMAGVVLSGSPAMVTDRAPWSERCAEWLAGVVVAGIPVLGICYGHQLLAHALGGEVGHHPCGIEIGTVEVERHELALDDPLLGELPPRFAAQVVHEQTVLRLPPGATPLAGNAHEPHQAFRIGTCAWGLQFHPEFGAEVMRGYVQQLGPRLPRVVDPALVMDTPEAADLLPRFARWVRARQAGRPVSSSSVSPVLC